jgi:heme exporter protein CcmD
MNWPDLSMGVYGFYIWGSYAFSLIAIVWELVSLSQRKKALAQQQRQTSDSVGAPVLRGSANETTS